jgi:hypothetical protein
MSTEDEIIADQNEHYRRGYDDCADEKQAEIDRLRACIVGLENERGHVCGRGDCRGVLLRVERPKIVYGFGGHGESLAIEKIWKCSRCEWEVR